MAPVITAEFLAGSHGTDGDNGPESRLTLRDACFRLHLVCEFGQLPEQVEAENTPLSLLVRPLGIKRVFRAEFAWRSQATAAKKEKKSAGV